MNKLSSEAKAMRARIINWQSPTVDDLKSIRTVEQMGEQLLDAILLYCPNNHERSEALDSLEVLLTWTRKSIIRGNGIDQ
ncbi:MAG TPA: hypothetical protein V6D37_16805 [Candidatus Sericytochromatia bacterium]|jgi:hypothetical protein